MANFNEMRITEEGKKIYLKTLKGNPLKVVRVTLGDGGARATDATEDVISPIYNSGFHFLSSASGETRCDLIMYNENFDEDVEISEIGIYCEDPDTKEVKCYSYAYAPEGGDIIPSAANGEVVWQMKLYLDIENVEDYRWAEQTDRLTYTPTIFTEGVSNVSAECEYVRKGSLVTAFYRITGNLSTASPITISTPTTASFYAPLCGRATVGGTIAAVSGTIEPNSSVAVIGTIGAGDFVLLFSAQYLA